MTSSFGEIQTAAKLRDIVTSMAKTTVEKMRPAERIGKVYSVDLGRRVAKIYFPGDSIDSLIEARFAADKIPTQAMIDTYDTAGTNAVGNIVRVAGGPGAYYILDYVSGIPAIDPSARALVLTNTVTINGNVTAVSNQVGSLSGNMAVLQSDLDAANVELDTLNNVTIPQLQTDLGNANADISALNSVTIPALNTRLTEAETDVNTLNTTTIPNLNTSLSNAQTQINTLNNTTIPNINGQLSANQTAINSLNGKFPIGSTDITDGAITTPKMTANSINGDRITANTLNADRIIANTVTAREVQAASITAKQLAIGDLTNRVVDLAIAANRAQYPGAAPQWQPYDFGTATNRWGIRTIPTGTPVGNYHYYMGEEFDVIPTEQYSISCEVWTGANVPYTLNVGLRIQNETGGVLSYATGISHTSAQTHGTWVAKTAVVTIPATGARAWPEVVALVGSTAMPASNNESYVRNFVIRRMNEGKLIVDGAIITNHMTAGTINGDRMTLNTLDADRIVAGSMTTDRFTANTIDGSVVTANTLNATKITAGTIATDRMTANTINGDRITGNTLNASKIIAGTITTDRMTANTINGDRISTNTLHGDKIIAGTIVASKLNVLAGGENLLLNSSFENADLYYTNWTKYDNSAVATTSLTTGRRGGNGLRLSWSAAASIVGLYQSVPGGWIGGQQYVFSVYAKAGGGAVGGTLAMASNAPAISYTWVDNPPLTTGWQRYIALCSRASTTTDPLYFGIAAGYGTAGVAKTIDFDDVQLEEGELVTAYSPMTDEILPGSISADMIQANAINGMTITGVTINGGTMRTAVSGNRVQMSNTVVDRVEWYDSAGALRSYIAGGAATSLFFYNANQQFQFNGPGGVANLSGVTNISMGGKIDHWGENVSYNSNTSNWCSYGMYSINIARMYNAPINRAMWLHGSGIYSAEGTLSIGCELYGNYIAWSDIKDKSDLKSFGRSKDAVRKKAPSTDSALDMMRKLPVYDYDTKHGGARKGDKGQNVLVRKRGIVAQDLQAVAPHLVHDETDDPQTGFGLGVDVYGLLASAIEAIRELDEEIEALKKEKNK